MDTPLKAEKDGHINCGKIPFIPHKDVPKHYLETACYFVDHSGFGRDEELAMTVDQFQAKIKKGRYYVVSGMGQFQLYVTEYRLKTSLGDYDDTRED